MVGGGCVGHQSIFEQLVVAVYGQLSIKVELCPPHFLALDLQLFGAAEIREMPLNAT